MMPQPPEIELLLCCARTQLTPAGRDRLAKLLQLDLRWEYLLDRATRHGVLPLLHHHLSAIDSDRVPPAILSQLRQFYQQHCLRNLRLTGELLKLLRLLESHQIAAVPFKGAVLAASVYGNLTLRSFADLDILVQPEDFFKTREFLLAQGFQSAQPSWFLTAAEETAFLQQRGECTLVSSDGQVSIDLHGRLVAGDFFSLRANFNSIWQRLQPVALAGQTTHSFSWEDLLLYLCIHGSKSLWERLSWICDIAQLIQSQPIDWPVLIERSQATGTERMLHLGLLLAADLLDAPLPPTLAQAVRQDAIASRLAQQVQQRLYGQIADLKPHHFGREEFLFRWAAMQRTADSWLYCFSSLHFFALNPLIRLVRPSRSDRLFVPLPRPYYFLYYFIRPVRLIHQSWSHAAKLLG